LQANWRMRGTGSIPRACAGCSRDSSSVQIPAKAAVDFQIRLPDLSPRYTLHRSFASGFGDICGLFAHLIDIDRKLLRAADA
jgi:hypothetical protein